VQKTRRQILDILKCKRTATLDELAREIGLSPVTVRAHLSVLERDDLITAEEVRGKIGRPHFVYSLEEAAESEFPATYDAVANRFLDGFKMMMGPDQSANLVKQVARQWATEHAARVDGKDLGARVAEVARIRTEEGAMAEWECCDGVYAIRQHNCPALRVARHHPEVCQAELEYMRILLGATVERSRSISGGDGSCSYRIPVQ